MKAVDAAVVGAGPAGATAARILGAEGLNVVLFEKASLPRYKPCGGGITLKSLRLIKPDQSIFKEKVDRVSFSYRGDAYTVDCGRPVTFLVDRSEYDFYLVRKAEEEGVKVYSPCAVNSVEEQKEGVIIRTQAEDFQAKYLILADGVNGKLGRTLDIGCYEAGITMEAEISCPREILQKFRGRLVLDYGMIDRGYGWIFPKSDYLSIGIGSFSGKYPAIKARFQQFLERYNLITGVKVLRQQGYPIPAGKTGLPLTTGRVAVAGDAAGLVDPISGEGIYYALLSGKWAGKAVAGALIKGNTLAGYQQQIEEKIWPEMRAARSLAGYFYHAPRLFHGFFKRYPAVFEKIIDILAGKNTYTDYFKGNWRDLFQIIRLLKARQGE